MDPSDGYVVGFRGRDAVYMLHDEGREIATKLHEAKLLTSEEQPVLIENIGTDHPNNSFSSRRFKDNTKKPRSPRERSPANSRDCQRTEY
jgi:hypothetical protein